MAKRIDPLSIGPYTFDHAAYEPEVDLLYLSVGPPGQSKSREDTPEGHEVDFDARGDLVGIHFYYPKRFLARDGSLTITLPVPRRLEAPAAVESLLA
jgi:uncharacterized protein YuzE